MSMDDLKLGIWNALFETRLAFKISELQPFKSMS